MEIFMSLQMEKARYVNSKLKNKKNQNISGTIHCSTGTTIPSLNNYQNIQESEAP